MSVITCRSNMLRGVSELARQRPAEELYNYIGGRTGAWEVTELTANHGSPLARVSHLDITNGPLERIPASTVWVLQGLVRSTRHVIREEHETRDSKRRNGMAEATCAALIPIRKSAAWWALDKLARLEMTQLSSWSGLPGQQFLSAVVRRLQNGRDLSGQFDEVTWFEYAPRDASVFNDLLAAWRASDEWKYVERDCDMRLTRVEHP